MSRLTPEIVLRRFLALSSGKTGGMWDYLTNLFIEVEVNKGGYLLSLEEAR